MRLVITGASGFVGRQIIPFLRQGGVELLLVGRSPERLLEQYPGEDTANYSQLAKKAMGADALLHLAVLNNNQIGSIEDFRRVNVILLKQVIDTCQSAGINRIIYTSSMHAGAVDSAYGQSKLEADELLNSIDKLVLIRFTLPAVYGDDAYIGKLDLLYKFPLSIRGYVFWMLRRFKQSVHAKTIAEAVIEFGTSNSSIDKILSDR